MLRLQICHNLCLFSAGLASRVKLLGNAGNSHKVNTFYQREVDFLDSINFIEMGWIDLIPE